MVDTEQGKRFYAMAERIDHGVERGVFGGAAVIIPPTVTGHEKPIELLMLDANADPAQFLSTVVTRIQIMLREIEDQSRMMQFGR
jgi:hypothetical protein